MPGYLEDYGVGDAKREKKVRWIVLSLLTIVIVGGVLYASLRNYSEESKIRQFLQALQRQDFQSAYAYWGCTAQTPCRDYPFDKFMEDWGPKGVNAKFTASGIGDSERCGTGFLAQLNSGSEVVAVWVERSSGLLSYAPWQQCPEKKLRLMKWLRMRFGQG